MHCSRGIMVNLYKPIFPLPHCIFLNSELHIDLNIFYKNLPLNCKVIFQMQFGGGEGARDLFTSQSHSLLMKWKGSGTRRATGLKKRKNRIKGEK